jgi:hypothetical protein
MELLLFYTECVDRLTFALRSSSVFRKPSAPSAIFHETFNRDDPILSWLVTRRWKGQRARAVIAFSRGLFARARVTALNRCDVKSGRTFVTFSLESDSVMIAVLALNVAAASSASLSAMTR